MPPREPVNHYEERRGRNSPAKTAGSPESIYSIPRGSVPPRSSSQARPLPTTTHLRQPSLAPPPPRGQDFTIPSHGQSRSPVREVAARAAHVTGHPPRRTPSRTFMRNPLPADILEFPTHRHPRVNAKIQVAAPIFVGGSSIEGNVHVVIDDAERIRHRKSLEISRISIDILGIEEVSGPRRAIFLALATELLDPDHPPPHNMVDSLKQISPFDPYWTLAPSVSLLPFMISLPLDVGPPPFQSKHAKIRYILCATLLVREHGKQYLVRQSQEVTVLSVYDPEKALMSLPSPLTASDEIVMPRDKGIEVIYAAAGLHRQVWVSGTSIFVDIHLANSSRKTIKKMELQLERDILCYKYAAAGTMEKSASQARIFESNERTILNRTVLKLGVNGWNGVLPHTEETRTCDLELPRGHATVKCGKYFEVRYFLNVIVTCSHTKTITLQLPIVLIHMNSLDVVPNSVAQVAAAIDEKLSHHSYLAAAAAAATGKSPIKDPHTIKRKPSSLQGRAFLAPRMHSLERLRAEAEEYQAIGQTLERSPRKYAPRHMHKVSTDRISNFSHSSSHPAPHGTPNNIRRMRSVFDYQTPPSNRKGRVLAGEDFEGVKNMLRHVPSNATVRSTAGPPGTVPSGLAPRPGANSAYRQANWGEHGGEHSPLAGRRSASVKGSVHKEGSIFRLKLGSRRREGKGGWWERGKGKIEKESIMVDRSNMI